MLEIKNLSRAELAHIANQLNNFANELHSYLHINDRELFHHQLDSISVAAAELIVEAVYSGHPRFAKLAGMPEMLHVFAKPARLGVEAYRFVKWTVMGWIVGEHLTKRLSGMPLHFGKSDFMNSHAGKRRKVGDRCEFDVVSEVAGMKGRELADYITRKGHQCASDWAWMCRWFADSINAPIPKARGKAKPNANDPRDQFIYDSLKDGKKLASIKSYVNGHDGWDPIERDWGITLAARRYATRHKLPAHNAQ